MDVKNEAICSLVNDDFSFLMIRLEAPLS